jgi:hypothetical protein
MPTGELIFKSAPVEGLSFGSTIFSLLNEEIVSFAVALVLVLSTIWFLGA